MRNFMEKPETADFTNALGVSEHKMTVDELLFLRTLQQDLRGAEVFKDPVSDKPNIFYYKVKYIGEPLYSSSYNEARVEDIRNNVFLSERAIAHYLNEYFADIPLECFIIQKHSLTLSHTMIKLFNILSAVDFVQLLSLPSVTPRL